MNKNMNGQHFFPELYTREPCELCNLIEVARLIAKNLKYTSKNLDYNSVSWEADGRS